MLSLTNDVLMDLLAKKGLSQLDKVLLLLYGYPGPQAYVHIRGLAFKLGASEIENWNLAQILARSKGFAVEIPIDPPYSNHPNAPHRGWILTLSGKKYLEEKYLADQANPIKEAAQVLRAHLGKIADVDTRAFVEESIGCLEAGLLRSAVVMSWVGAISILYDHVLANRLVDFNVRASQVKKDWKPAVTKDDLAKMKEADFLDILAYLSIIGGNIKEDLKSCLNLRNSCGHPSSYKVGKHKVGAHIDSLILNVYERF
jgi:hypothetical protein